MFNKLEYFNCIEIYFSIGCIFNFFFYLIHNVIFKIDLVIRVNKIQVVFICKLSFNYNSVKQ